MVSPRHSQKKIPAVFPVKILLCPGIAMAESPGSASTGAKVVCANPRQERSPGHQDHQTVETHVWRGINGPFLTNFVSSESSLNWTQAWAAKIIRSVKVLYYHHIQFRDRKFKLLDQFLPTGQSCPAPSCHQVPVGDANHGTS